MKKFIAIFLTMLIIITMMSTVFASPPDNIEDVGREIDRKGDRARDVFLDVMRGLSILVMIVCIVGGMVGGSQKFKTAIKYGFGIAFVVGVLSWGWLAIENFLFEQEEDKTPPGATTGIERKIDYRES